MCFSATASLIAGGSLTIMGAVSLKKVKSKSEILFASIPLLFGIQQLIEGILWLSIYREYAGVQSTMAYLFTGISRVIWPIYVPLSVLALESVAWRKKAILSFLPVGVASSLYLLYFIVTDGVSAEVVGHHIVYCSSHRIPFLNLVFYVAATCLSCFFSSHRYVRIFGGLCILGFASAYLVSEIAAFSIWCFFAGLISFYILFHFNVSARKCKFNN